MAKAEVSARCEDDDDISEESPARDAAPRRAWLEWEPATKRHYAALLILPFVVRMVVALELASNPLDTVPIIDAQHYDDVAKSIVDGSFSMTSPFWQPPLYEFFLAGIYAVFGHSLAIARAVQALLGSLSCLLVFAITRRLFGIRPAWIAYLMASMYGTLVFHNFELLPSSLFVFLQTLLLWGCLNEPSGAKGVFGRGALFGLATITVPNILVSAPLFAWCAARRKGVAPRKDFGRAAAWALGAFLIVSPVTLANYTASGEMILVSHNNGINFFIGNNPDYDKTFAIRPGYRWKMLDMMPSLEGKAVSPRERASFYVHKSTEWMSREPAAAARLFLKKMVLLASGNEIPRNQEIYPFRDDSRLLALLMWNDVVAFPFGVMLPLAAIGIALSSRSCNEVRSRRILLVYSGFYSLSVLAFFVTARHRLPLVPVLLPFAGFAVYRMAQFWKEGARGSFALTSAAVVGLVVVCNTWGGAPETEFGSGTLTELGFHFWGTSEIARSTLLLDQAVRLDPENVDAATALADRLLASGHGEEALAKLAPLGPIFPELGLDALTKPGQTRDATVAHARQALAEIQPRAQLWPEMARAREALAERYAAEGATREAGENLAGAADLYTRTGQSYLRAGRVDLALPNFAKAMALRPNLVPAINGVGIGHAARGEIVKAAELWLRALKIDPEDAEAKALLAKARPALEMAKQHL